ncbi:carbamoyltransferase, partial [Acidobacteria bacterium AH-259-L09]|nr:carbamoyltransferase [Acidobacteria bacterium AH-259-L09]
RIVAALQEERFSRRKHDSSFPSKAIAAVLKIGQCSVSDLDYVVFYEKPFSKLERLLETYLRHCPRGFASYLKAIPVWIKEKIWMKELIRRKLEYEGEILFADHHESHAASAFYPSPFESAALLTVDAVGEWTTTALGRGKGSEIQLESEIRFPHSLGLLYTTFTYYLGFEVNSGEYKVMGLAPYGNPTYQNLIQERLIDIHEDGSFRLNTEFFDFETGLKMASSRFEQLFGAAPRKPNDPLSQEHKDIAASIQKVTEEVILRMCKHLRRKTGEKYLCMAGGVALNCVANGRVMREVGFEDLWIQPAAGDAGGALGAALAVWHRFLGHPRSKSTGLQVCDQQQGSLLGTEYDKDEIRACLDSQGAKYEELQDSSLITKTAQVLAQGAVIAWFQGRMEFGPRALGNRSILADPRKPDMHKLINLRVKFRESFRPFAPAVMQNHVSKYFELDCSSPYMLLVAPVRDSKRCEIPAVTHVDGSARIQTVGKADNPRFHRLLEEFQGQTGSSVLLNTSFNVRGEPIVESPQQAYQCFMRTGIDFLSIGNFFLSKRDQPSGLND